MSALCSISNAIDAGDLYAQEEEQSSLREHRGAEGRKAMHERKHGTLRSGRSGKKVTSRKQAIAIGLSEARRAGGKVPSKPK
jgi:hypothetical protein